MFTDPVSSGRFEPSSWALLPCHAQARKRAGTDGSPTAAAGKPTEGTASSAPRVGRLPSSVLLFDGALSIPSATTLFSSETVAVMGEARGCR